MEGTFAATRVSPGKFLKLTLQIVHSSFDALWGRYKGTFRDSAPNVGAFGSKIEGTLVQNGGHFGAKWGALLSYSGGGGAMAPLAPPLDQSLETCSSLRDIMIDAVPHTCKSLIDTENLCIQKL